MKLIKKKFSVMQFRSINEITGYIFESNGKKFGMSSTSHIINIYELSSGGRVLWFDANNLLNITDEQQIEFAKTYINMIKPEDWEKALTRVKADFSYIDFPINSKHGTQNENI